MASERFDVLIIGAGLSGIGAGCHMKMDAPGKTYAILEGRAALGGTWDLFRYPGIRSDSDMYTLGYSFRPWREAKAMADRAAPVTMLQRSPTYVVSRPAEDAFANMLRRRLPDKLAYGITRWRNVLLQLLMFKTARRKPAKFKQRLIAMVKAELGEDYDVGTHFTPTYNPWDQRLCLVPDSDLFASIRSGQASVVTDTIDTFTESGLRLTSGRELDADVIITATGLKMRILSGIAITVDGDRVDLAKSMSYKGMMYSGVPNLASVFGYTNASWTLKADLTCEYFCRLMKFMDSRFYAEARPTKQAGVVEAPFIDFSSGYIQRALDQLPRQGVKKPWKLHQNYALDLLTLRYSRIDDGTLLFKRKPVAVRAA